MCREIPLKTWKPSKDLWRFSISIILLLKKEYGAHKIAACGGNVYILYVPEMAMDCTILL